MKALLLIVPLALVIQPVLATPISTTEAYGNVGQCMTVEGHAAVMADSSRPGMDIVLDGDGSGHAPFLGYARDPDSIPGLASLDGQSVDITGVVLIDRGVAEIQLTSPDYIWAAGNAPDRLIACDHD